MKIIARLPNAGLANKLLVWAEAVVFANKANIQSNKIIVYPWVDFHPKRILRKDNDQRLYVNFFNTNDIISWFKSTVILNKVDNPNFNEKIQKHLSYRFSTTPLPTDYFKNIRGYENVIKEALYKIVCKENIDFVDEFPEYDVAVHVRRGDFPKELRVSNDDVLKVLERLKEHFSRELKVYLFSDGTKEELEILLQDKNVTLIQGNKAIVDLMLMSKAKVIVPSVRSTFSYFAAFISDAHVIRHSHDNLASIRNEKFPFYEGKNIDEISNRVEKYFK